MHFSVLKRIAIFHDSKKRFERLKVNVACMQPIKLIQFFAQNQASWLRHATIPFLCHDSLIKSRCQLRYCAKNVQFVDCIRFSHQH